MKNLWKRISFKT